MTIKEWKNNELNMLLMKKWGLLQEGAALDEAHWEEEDPAHAKVRAGKRGDYGALLPDEVMDSLVDPDELSPWGPSRRHANPIKALTAKDYEGIGSEESEDEEDNRPSLSDPLKKGKGLEEGCPHPDEDEDEQELEESDEPQETNTLTVKEAKNLARRIFNRLQKEN